jgi:hypothetical protein
MAIVLIFIWLTLKTTHLVPVPSGCDKGLVNWCMCFKNYKIRTNWTYAPCAIVAASPSGP